MGDVGDGGDNGGALAARIPAAVARAPDAAAPAMAVEDALDSHVAAAASEWRATTDAEARAAVQRRLDELYWPLLDRVLARAALRGGESGLASTPDELMLVNFGVIDPSLVPPDVAGRLNGELSDGAGGRIAYLSERLDGICRAHHAETRAADSTRAPSSTQYVSHLREMRLKVLRRLAPHMDELPGVSPDAAARMLSGALDDDLLRLGLVILARPERPLLVHRRSLKALRENILDKTRRRLRAPADLRLLDILQELYLRDWRERREDRERRAADANANANAAAIAAPASAGGRNAAALLTRLRAEVESLKEAALMAAALGGETRLAPAFVGGAPRLTRPEAARMLALAAVVDREGEAGDGLILPFSGRGAAAWKAGMLVLALRPVVGADDSAATALGHWRVLADRHQHGGELAKAYAGMFPKGDFERDFVKDYRVFLTKTAQGDSLALSRERWAFIRDRIGPETRGPLVPRNLRQIGPQTREAIARRMEKQLAQSPADGLMRKRLAALYWLDRRHAASLEMLKEALRIAPADAEAALSLGFALRAVGQDGAADGAFKLGMERGKGCLWGLYCADALNGWV